MLKCPKCKLSRAKATGWILTNAVMESSADELTYDLEDSDAYFIRAEGFYPGETMTCEMCEFEGKTEDFYDGETFEDDDSGAAILDPIDLCLVHRYREIVFEPNPSDEAKPGEVEAIVDLLALRGLRMKGEDVYAVSEV